MAFHHRRLSFRGPPLEPLRSRHLQPVSRVSRPWRRCCPEPVLSVSQRVSHPASFPARIEIPFAAPSDRYGFVGSCNGLICVAKSSGDGIERAVYLWNLFTRKHKAGRLYGPEEQQFLSMARGRVLLGFYFDASDYHLVRILHFPGVRRWSFWNRKRRDRKPRVKIYSLSTDSWRTVECEVPALSYSNRAVFLNVNLHWYAFDRKGVNSDQ